ncbi:hypothetical protein D3C76_129470 [compost metagenome]
MKTNEFEVNKNIEGLHPLATRDQEYLDKLSIDIYKDLEYASVKQRIWDAFSDAYNGPLTSEAEDRLHVAIEELVFSTVQKAVNNDPYNPYVYSLIAPPRNWFGLQVPGGRFAYDNPDAIYRTIPIDVDSKYIIHGQCSEVRATDIIFSLLKSPHDHSTISFLDGESLLVNQDGSFTITVDSEPANGRPNHIQSTNEAKQLFIRDVFGNWFNETANALTVERISENDLRKPRTRSTIVEEIYESFPVVINSYSEFLKRATYSTPINTLSNPILSSTIGALITQTSSFGHFKLLDDEALVVTVELGGAGYFILPVTDPWMISVDSVSHQSSLNNLQSIPNDDGTYTFVISAYDPGVHNWIDTAGLHEGTIMARWQKISNDTKAKEPSIHTQVVKLEQFHRLLPEKNLGVTSQERMQQLLHRRDGYARRTTEI